MVLAAGFGARMRPLTDDRPKPLVKFRDKALIDHVLDRLAQAGITTAVVNVHYRSDQITTHVRQRLGTPQIAMSDECAELLDTGGGVVNALALLGGDAFVVHNSDSVWVDERDTCNLQRLFASWDGDHMDCLMLLADPAPSLGYDGSGDFVMAKDGSLQRRTNNNDDDALAFTGVSIAHQRLFETAPSGPFSMNLVWDRAIAAKRLFGLRLKGT